MSIHPHDLQAMHRAFHFDGAAVRTVTIGGQTWFAGKDACDVLEIAKHHQALAPIPEDERGTYTIGTPSGLQPMIFVSEPGLYRLIFKSRKPVAERFKTWVVTDVLPALRERGFYAFAPGEADDPAEEGDDNFAPNRAAAPASIYDRHDWWQVAREKIGLCNVARLIHGRAAAAELWRTVGLPFPDQITAQDQGLDSVDRFLRLRCRVTGQQGHCLPTREFVRLYEEWCDRQGLAPVAGNTCIRLVRERMGDLNAMLPPGSGLRVWSRMAPVKQFVGLYVIEDAEAAA